MANDMVLVDRDYKQVLECQGKASIWSYTVIYTLNSFWATSPLLSGQTCRTTLQAASLSVHISGKGGGGRSESQVSEKHNNKILMRLVSYVFCSLLPSNLPRAVPRYHTQQFPVVCTVL